MNLNNYLIIINMNNSSPLKAVIKHREKQTKIEKTWFLLVLVR